MMSWDGARVLAAGAGGVLGSALVARLTSAGADVLPVDRAVGDLRDAGFVRALFSGQGFDAVFVIAGPCASAAWQAEHGAQLLRDNAAIAAAVIGAAIDVGTPRLVYAASAALYPEHAPQPFAETALFSGPFEAGHLDYAIGKAVGVRLCQAAREAGLSYTAAILTNLYGPGARLEPARAHVIPALIARALTGEGPLRVHGDGAALRDVLFGADAASALMRLAAADHGFDAVNVASGAAVSIGALATLVAERVGCDGVVFEASRGVGVDRRIMDVARLHSIWAPMLTPLSEGIDAAIADIRARL